MVKISESLKHGLIAISSKPITNLGFVMMIMITRSKTMVGSVKFVEKFLNYHPGQNNG